MNLVIELPHLQYESAIYTKPDLAVKSASFSPRSRIEILTIEVHIYTITSVYKPSNIVFAFKKLDNFDYCDTKIVLSYFNSHSVTWEYQKMDWKEENIELWAEAEGLSSR